MKNGTVKEQVKRWLALLMMVLVLAGCGAAARESSFYDHNTMYRDWDHMKFSLWGYKAVDQKEAQQSKEENWWGTVVQGNSK